MSLMAPRACHLNRQFHHHRLCDRPPGSGWCAGGLPRHEPHAALRRLRRRAGVEPRADVSGRAVRSEAVQVAAALRWPARPADARSAASGSKRVHPPEGDRSDIAGVPVTGGNSGSSAGVTTQSPMSAVVEQYQMTRLNFIMGNVPGAPIGAERPLTLMCGGAGPTFPHAETRVAGESVNRASGRGSACTARPGSASASPTGLRAGRISSRARDPRSRSAAAQAT